MKIIGILSDTHDNLQAIAKAKRVFAEKKVDMILHAGDFVAPFAVKSLLSGWAGEFRGVFGNNDGEKEGLKLASKERIVKAPAFFTIEKTSFCLTHILPQSHKQMLECDIVIFGHTHKQEHYTKSTGDKQTLFINPGEAGGWLTNVSSLVLLHLPSRRFEYITLA